MQLPVDRSNVTSVLTLSVLFCYFKVAASHKHLHHLQATRNEMKLLVKFKQKVNLPASENSHVKNVRLIVVDRKVQIRF